MYKRDETIRQVCTGKKRHIYIKKIKLLKKCLRILSQNVYIL